VVTCSDNENGTINHKVDVRDSLWTHSLFNVWIYDGAAEKIMEALSWTSAKLKQLEQQQLSLETAMGNIYFVDMKTYSYKEKQSI
jgi:thymidylate synthase